MEKSGQIIRRAHAGDVGAITRLAATVETMPRWSRAHYEAYDVAERGGGDTQVKAMFVACVPVIQNQVIGFAAFSAISGFGGEECELENILVAEAWRRQGVAEQLLTAGLLWCRAWAASAVRLEVRASNHGAILFYERTSFSLVGNRHAYYTGPIEDAILMRRPLDASFQNGGNLL